MILEASSPEEISQVRRLFLEYAASLGFSLCLQNFQQEVDALPGKYSPPDGVLLLAAGNSGEPAGCVGVRPLDDNACEMKRLYVRPSSRGAGTGRRLVEAAVAWARTRRYRAMKLDTVPGRMDAAILLYRSLGFVECAPYYETPIEGSLFFTLALWPGNAGPVAQRPTIRQLETIRRATARDAEGILRCLRLAFEPYRRSYTEAAFADTVLTPETIADRLRIAKVFVAVSKGQEVVGTIGCQVVSAEEGHLRGMAVVPEWQGSGIAERLLLCAERELRDAGCSRIRLDTTEPLKRAMWFYEKQGFRASGKVTDFFGMPLYEYVKELTSPAALD